MNAWVFLHWSIISLCFSGYIFLCVDRLALCLVLWFMLGCYLLHFSMGCMFDLTHPYLNPLFQTCNMAWMGSFYPFHCALFAVFPCSWCPTMVNTIVLHYVGDFIPESTHNRGLRCSWCWRRQVLAGAGWRRLYRRGEVVIVLKPGAEGEASWKKREVLGLGLSWGIRPNPILALVLDLSWSSTQGCWWKAQLLLMLATLMAQVHDEWTHLVTSYPNKF